MPHTVERRVEPRSGAVGAAPRRPASARLVLGALAALLALGLAVSAVVGGSAPGSAPAAPRPSDVLASAGPALVVDDVELAVEGFHLLRPEADDPAAQQAAAAQSVPVAQLAQMHLILRLRNTGTSPRSVAQDVLQLGLGAQRLEAATGDVFPLASLAPGEVQPAEVGFDLVVRGGAGPVTLLWTHGGRTETLPIGAARRAA